MAVLHMCENSTPHVEGRKGRKEEGKRGVGGGKKHGGEGRGGQEDLHSAPVKMLIFICLLGSDCFKVMIYCDIPSGLAKCHLTAKFCSYLNQSISALCSPHSHLESNQR